MKIRICLLLMSMLLLSACTRQPRTDAPMEYFRFSHSGMSTGSIYTLTAERTDSGWAADFDLFCTHEFVLPMSQEDVERLAHLIDSENLWTWNGFDRTARNVSDGESFALNIRFADGQEISASGSNAFPKGYDTVEEAIKAFFTEIMEANGMDKLF